MHAEEALGLVAGRALGGGELLALLRAERRRDRAPELSEERVYALRELFSVACAVGARRRQRECLPSFHEGLETYEVHGFLEALAQLRFDARVEIGGLIRVAAQRRAEERARCHGLGLTMLRS